MGWKRVTAITLGCGIGLFAAPTRGQNFTIRVPGGEDIELSVSHAGPQRWSRRSPYARSKCDSAASVFSAPLPSGSGARALGLAGAFTALADDATAASWNPAGLIQLERPEASAVYRFSSEKDEHVSTDSNLRVGDNEFDSDGLNYLSFVYPFHLKSLSRNAVVSLNFQEAYDFTARFTADLTQASQGGSKTSSSGTFNEMTEETFTQEVILNDTDKNIFFVAVQTETTTEAFSALNQTIESELISDLDFSQDGSIAAFTPALCLPR